MPSETQTKELQMSSFKTTAATQINKYDAGRRSAYTTVLAWIAQGKDLAWIAEQAKGNVTDVDMMERRQTEAK